MWLRAEGMRMRRRMLAGRWEGGLDAFEIVALSEGELLGEIPDRRRITGRRHVVVVPMPPVAVAPPPSPLLRRPPCWGRQGRRERSEG